jgi:type IV secretion system protein VirB6
MISACQTIADDGVIRGVLATVDCQTRAYAQVGYSALTSGNSMFQTALTALLTIYVAFIGYRMMFARGDVRLSDAPGIALKIGVILALVTSWSTFQTLVFDVADRAPVEIAGVVSSPFQGSGSLASRPVDGLQVAYDEMTQSAIAFSKKTQPGQRAYATREGAAAEGLSTAAGALFVMSAGVISASTLAIGVLTAVGPVFVALFLIPATRGFFVGWVRALVAAALTPMVGWLLIVLSLVVLEPWLVTLADQRRAETLDPQTGLSVAALVFVFAFAQAALVIGACVMAIAFKLPRSVRDSSSAARAASAGAGGPDPIVQPSRAERLAMELQRDSVQAATRARSLALAAQVAPGARVQAAAPATASAEAPTRLGESYRRNSFVARRAGGAR